VHALLKGKARAVLPGRIWAQKTGQTLRSRRAVKTMLGQIYPPAPFLPLAPVIACVAPCRLTERAERRQKEGRWVPVAGFCRTSLSRPSSLILMRIPPGADVCLFL
jgi:hypothetical protein